MTSAYHLQEWRNHRDANAQRIKTLAYEIRTAAQVFDVDTVWRLAGELDNACGEYKRSLKPIVEWEGIVAMEAASPAVGEGDDGR